MTRENIKNEFIDLIAGENKTATFPVTDFFCYENTKAEIFVNYLLDKIIEMDKQIIKEI